MGLGIAGFYLPLLPGVLFLILAAYCFMRCSPKYYNRIINNKFYGSYVKNFIECGPGRVLQGLVKKINRESNVSSL